MIHKDASRPQRQNGERSRDPLDTFDAAIGDVVRSTFALISAISQLAYAAGARVRGELEHALARAQAIAERIADRAARAEALRQLGELQAIATRQLIIAPAPSSAAIAAANAGDETAWLQEEQAWVAHRLAHGASPDFDGPRRARRDTQPGSPRALRGPLERSGEAPDATAPASPQPPAAARAKDDEP